MMGRNRQAKELPCYGQFTSINMAPRTSPVILRSAIFADLAVLRHWDKQPHILAAKGDEDWAWETELQKRPDWREQLIAEVDARPVGFVEIIDPAREESHYWGDVPPNLRAIDIWIGEAGDLGKGYGASMMRLAIARCFANPAVLAILVDPLATNTRAHRFYERLGFRCVERRRFGQDDCFVYRLDRAMARLRSIISEGPA
jgi:aminoglycoside 6'-N-acetyltransferase